MMPGARACFAELAHRASGSAPRRLEAGAPWASVSELLAQNAVFEAMAGIEQHVHFDRMVHADLNRGDRAHFGMIGDGGDRPFVRFEHFDGHVGAIG
jgi:hypothetical protein